MTLETGGNPFTSITQAAGGEPGADNPFSPITRAAGVQHERVADWMATRGGRFLQGAAEPVVGAAQLAAHLTGIGSETMDKAARRQAELYQASKAQAGFKPGQLDYVAGLGNIISPINLVPGSIVGRALGPAASVAGLAGRGAATGAAYGLTQPTTETHPDTGYLAAKAEQVGSGALGGALAGPIVSGVTNAIVPQIAPAVRRLAAMGVEMTPGQIYEPLRRTEEILSKTPLVGGFVRGAQQHSIDTFNHAVGNDALMPVRNGHLLRHDQIIPPNTQPGYEVAQTVDDTLSDIYDQLLDRMHFTSPRVPSQETLWDVLNNAHEILPQPQYKRLSEIVDHQLANKLLNSPHMMISGDVLKSVQSALGNFERGYVSSPDPDVRNLGRALGDVRRWYMNELAIQNPYPLNPARPNYLLSDALRDTDAAWSRYVLLREATASRAANVVSRQGEFSPGRYANVVQGAARTEGQAARGEAQNIRLAADASSILPPQVNDSGTPERAATMALLMGLSPWTPQMAALGATIPIMYSGMGLPLARRYLLAQRPQFAHTLADLARQYGSTTGVRAGLNAYHSGDDRNGYADGGEPVDGASEGGSTVDSLKRYGREGLAALRRIPQDVRQYAAGLPPSEGSAYGAIMGAPNWLAEQGVNVATGGKYGLSDLYGAMGLPTQSTQAGIDAVRAYGAPAFQAARDLGSFFGAAGPGMRANAADAARAAPAAARQLGEITEPARAAFAEHAIAAGRQPQISFGWVGARNLAKAAEEGHPHGSYAPAMVLEMAERMRAMGYDDARIWEETGKYLAENDPSNRFSGAHFGADGQPRVELVTHDTPSFEKYKGASMKLPEPSTMAETFPNPTLEAAYPGYGNVPVKYVHEEGGYFDPNTTHIGLGVLGESKKYPKRAVLIHETQHYVTEQEPTHAPGGDPISVNNALLNRYFQIRNEAQTLPKDSPQYAQLDNTANKILGVLQQTKNDPSISMNAYRRISDEVDARNAARRNLAPISTLRLLSPQSTQDIPTEQQIVLPRQSGNVLGRARSEGEGAAGAPQVAETGEQLSARGQALMPPTFNRMTAVRFVSPYSPLAQAYESGQLSGVDLYQNTKQAVTGLKAIYQRIQGIAKDTDVDENAPETPNQPMRIPVRQFEDWAAPRHRPNSNNYRENRIAYSIGDAEAAGYVRTFTQNGVEYVQITPIGLKAWKRFRTSRL